MNEELMRQARTSAGATCPSCNKFVKVYTRKLNSGMARTLIHIYRQARKTNNEWLDVLHHCTNIGFVAGEVGKLVWWGLLQKHTGKAKDGNSNGLYRMTRKGSMFVKQRITVPSYAVEYMSKVEKFEGDDTDIIQALDNEFNYRELMGENAL